MLLENNRGHCPWCKQGTAFHQVEKIHYASPGYGGQHSYHAGLEGPTRTGVLIFQCLHCDKTVVLLEHELKPAPDVLPDGKTWRTMVAPHQEPKSLPEAAPEGACGLYTEASRCEAAGALRGAGVLYRAAVEEIVKDQGAEGPNLYAKIENLRDQLGDDLVDDLHEARMLGNDSIHAGLAYSADEVEDIAKLIDEAVLVLYVQPQQKQAMREARKARRQSAKQS